MLALRSSVGKKEIPLLDIVFFLQRVPVHRVQRVRLVWASAASAASALHVAIMPVNPPLTQGEKKIERGERDRESLAGEG